MSLTAPTVTGYSAFWQITGDKAAYSMSQAQGRAKDAWFVARRMRGFPTRDAVGALAQLIGAAPGGVATNSYSSVPNPLGPTQTVPQVTGVGDLGGLRTSVTSNAINRATTAADVTELKRWFSSALVEAGITYPTRLGSGGGSMIRGGMSAFA
jgi:hypothetical protein